ncbi:MAG: CHAT domain-containing protein [Bacteroidetes bacterium]|nr:CHAT domain-containing protein [Bacteroidota bacterium]
MLTKYFKQFILSHNKKLKSVFLISILAILLGMPILSFSQPYSIKINVMVNPPYPTKPAAWAEDNTKIIASIINLSPNPQNYWLVGYLNSDVGISCSTNDLSIPSQPAILQPNETKFLYLSDLKNILNFNNVNYQGITKDEIIRNGLPEGEYTICIRAKDYYNGNFISEEGPSGCSNPINLLSVETPMIIGPMCDEMVVQTNPQNVIFSWTRPAGSPNLVQYVLRIVEVTPINRNINDAMNSATQPIFFEQTVNTNVFVYGPGNPLLVAGKKYAFSVKAEDPTLQTSFKNNGISEVCSFIYGDTAKVSIPKDTIIKDNNATLLYNIPPLPSILPSYTEFIPNDFSYKDSTLAALLKSYQKAKIADNKYAIAEIAFYTGRLHLMNFQFNLAIKSFGEAIDSLKRVHSTRNLWIPYANLSYCYRITGNANASRMAINSAFKVLEQIPLKSNESESSTYHSELINAQELMFEMAIKQCLESNKMDSALVFLEKSNNYGKSRTRGVEPMDYGDGSSRTLLERENKLYKTVDSLYSLLIIESSNPSAAQDLQKLDFLKKIYSVTESNYLNFIDSIIVEKPELSVNFSSNINPKDLFKDKQLIPENTLVIEYLVSDSAIYAFVVRKDTIISKIIPATKSTIENAVDNYVQMLAKNSKITYIQKLSSELYNYLILPMEGIIRPGENIAIVPSGKLLKLPFQSLVKSGNAKAPPVYLIEKNPIYYINSLRLFYLPNTKAAGNYKVIAFGNPDNSLPFAEVEVNGLKTINSESEIYVKDAATETKAKSIGTGFDAIHFATHGVLDFSKFQNSYILLAADKEKKNDGKLTLGEIVGITNLRNLNMVTLSACNTAVSDQKVKGWINNPAQSFIDIGVKSVVATLWAVDDKATSLIMSEFYTNLKTKSKVESIRDSQLKLIKSKEFQHPYYWAPFVLIGDYR